MTQPNAPVAPDRYAPRWSDPHLGYFRLVGDVEADAAVAQILADPQLSASGFFRWLVRNGSPVPSEIPPAIAHYFEDTALPAFARPDLIREGQRVFTKWGPQICISLFCASLPIGYTADRIARVLHSTGRLESTALRRVFETAQMLFDVLDNGGLDPEGSGIRAAQRVRLMHAGVRHLIAAADVEIAEQSRIDGRPHPPLWPLEWGKPINQEDLAGTLLTFTTVVFDALERLGVRLTDDERAAYLHTWRVIGHFMGIVDEMLPRDEADARLLWAAEERRQLYRASEEGRHMAAALVGGLGELVPGRRFDFVARGLVRYLSGPRACEAVGVKGLGWGSNAVFAAYMRLNRFLVREEQRHPHFLNITGRFGRDLIHGLVNHEQADFAIPTRLRDHWEIEVPESVPAEAASADEGPVPAARP